MDLIREQQRRNGQSTDAWQLYSSHRSKVTQLLLNASSIDKPNLCLCLLGAGNVNDVDLRQLLTRFRTISLADLDVDAVQNGVVRQGFAADERIEILAATDVTGIFDEFSAHESSATTYDVFIDRCITKAEILPAIAAPESFDVVASVGLLSQLLDGVVRSLGETHPRFWNLASAVRAQHLRLLLNLVRPGGVAVLVTELVSSDSCSALNTTTEIELPTLLRQSIAAGNFFHGANPAALRHFLQTDARLSPQLAAIQFTNPWLWQFIARTYAVYGVLLSRRPLASE